MVRFDAQCFEMQICDLSLILKMEINVFYPKSGWVEQDPVEMITKQLQVAKRVVDKSEVAEASIAGIGITNQRETTILWNRDTGRPIGNAIVWFFDAFGRRGIRRK